MECNKRNSNIRCAIFRNSTSNRISNVFLNQTRTFSVLTTGGGRGGALGGERGGGDYLGLKSRCNDDTKIIKTPTSSKKLWKEFRKGLKIKKVPAFQTVSEDFFIKSEEILYNAEKNLIELLLSESSKVIAKIEVDFSNEIHKLHPDD